MKAVKYEFLRFAPRLWVLIVLFGFSVSGCELWGKYENPADPESETYAGYATVDSAASVTAVTPADGEDISAWTFTVSKVVNAEFYQLQIATDTAFSSLIYDSAAFTTNEMTATGLTSYGKWYWRARAKKTGEAWSTVWTTSRMFTRTLSVTGVVSTFAGVAGTSGSTNSIVTPTFYLPRGICSDGTYYYIADAGNHTIRRMNISSGVVTTFAGLAGYPGSTNGTGTAARFSSPTGVCTDGTYLYVADSSNNMIRRIVLSSGVVTTFAGSTTSGTANGTGTAARFYFPNGICCVGGATLYVADSYNNKVRKIDIASVAVTDFAGSGTYGYSNGTGGLTATFRYPFGLCSDGTNLYVADTYSNMIRQIVISSQAVSYFAGSTSAVSGSTNASGTSASFYYPYDVCTDGTNLFVADYNNYRIRKIVISGAVVTTLAGTSYGFVDGTSTSARFYNPGGVYADGTNVIVGDTNNHSIRKIVASTAVVTTLGGTGSSGSQDTNATPKFYSPQGVCSDGQYYYVADTSNHTIRKIAISTGVTTTLAGTAGTSGSANGTGTAATFSSPRGICLDGTNTNLYVADTGNHQIRKIVISTGAVTTFAGSTTSGTTNSTGTSARFYYPYGICADSANLYVADTNNNMIRKIVISTALVSTLAGSTTSGTTDATGTSARFNAPTGIATDGTTLYVADYGNHRIRTVTISGGVVGTLAGSSSGLVNGTGTAARFYYPQDVAYGSGCLYVADSYNNVIRKIVAASAAVTTLAGGSSTSSGVTDGTGTSARFYRPSGIAFDYAGLVVADTSNHTIRVIK